ncbi:hypothetical protein FOXYSP1_11391 [Fusarium oxysporum f. sp. phaseoli]
MGERTGSRILYELWSYVPEEVVARLISLRWGWDRWL